MHEASKNMSISFQHGERILEAIKTSITKGGTYDCIAILNYYSVCKSATSFREIEENLIIPSFRKLKFVNIDKPFFTRLMYMAFCLAKKRCDRCNDYKMDVVPYEKGKPIYYKLTSCPVAEFAKNTILKRLWELFVM